MKKKLNALKRWYEVDLDGSKSRVEAFDESDAIRVARVGRPTDVKSQVSVECDAPVEEVVEKKHKHK